MDRMPGGLRMSVLLYQIDIITILSIYFTYYYKKSIIADDKKSKQEWEEFL